MPGRSRSAALLAALAAAWWCVGCAAQAPITVVHDPHDDLSRYRTWDWIEGKALVVRAPAYDVEQVETQLAGLIENGLRERGFVRAPGAGEMRVAVLLVARRTLQAVRHANAMQTLTSFHETLYEVESDVADLRPVDRYRVSIYVTGPQQERVLWQGELTDQRADGFVEYLPKVIDTLLAEFPPPASALAAD
jgi:uncharacterized protein DUF4136